MWVAKLGGSLYDTTSLGDWVARFAGIREPVVVVPGGGPFADQVRLAQHRWQFDDWYAHAMALRAMEQMGLLLCGLNQRLVPCSDIAAIRATMGGGRVAVWMPSREVLAQRGIAANWSVTSDSLTLWLAKKLVAKGVLMIKSARLPLGKATVAAMQNEGILDSSFARYAQGLNCPIMLLHRSYDGPMDEVLAGHSEHVLQVVLGLNPTDRAEPSGVAEGSSPSSRI